MSDEAEGGDYIKDKIKMEGEIDTGVGEHAAASDGDYAKPAVGPAMIHVRFHTALPDPHCLPGFVRQKKS